MRSSTLLCRLRRLMRSWRYAARKIQMQVKSAVPWSTNILCEACCSFCGLTLTIIFLLAKICHVHARFRIAKFVSRHALRAQSAKIHHHKNFPLTTTLATKTTRRLVELKGDLLDRSLLFLYTQSARGKQMEPTVRICTLLKMGSYSSTTVCQYWDNC